MHIRRFTAAWIVFILLGLGLLSLPDSSSLWSQTQIPTVNSYMRLKLEPAKQILEGIATGDFEMIARSAQRVQTLTLDEKWMVLQSDQYSKNSQHFQRSVLQVLESARNKNLDGAALAYVQMTLNCVHCHRDMRAAK